MHKFVAKKYKCIINTKFDYKYIFIKLNYKYISYMTKFCGGNCLEIWVSEAKEMTIKEIIIHVFFKWITWE